MRLFTARKLFPAMCVGTLFLAFLANSAIGAPPVQLNPGKMQDLNQKTVIKDLTPVFPPGAIKFKNPQPPAKQPAAPPKASGSDLDKVMDHAKTGIDAWNTMRGVRGFLGRPRPGYTRPHYGPYAPGGYYDQHHNQPDYWDDDQAVPDYGQPPTEPDYGTPPVNPLPFGHVRVGEIGKLDERFDFAVSSAIVNPATNKVTLVYLLNGKTIKLPPGHYQNLGKERAWTIRFDRGGNLGEHRYKLKDAVFVFTPTEDGWNLFRNRTN